MDNNEKLIDYTLVILLSVAICIIILNFALPRQIEEYLAKQTNAEYCYKSSETYNEFQICLKEDKK